MAILATQEEKMRMLVTAWAQINSGSANPKGLAAMQKELAQAFATLGGIGTELPIGLSIKKRPHAKRIVFLGGHMDTVFGPDHPFQTVTDHGQRLQGPGVTDMKGGLVVMLFALQALENSPHAANIGWEVLINNDEECGSPNSAPYLQECAKRCSVGLIFEPSFADGALASARKGSAVYHVHAHGRTAHVGRDPEQGKNAVVPLARFVSEISSFQDLDVGIVINVGSIQGGSPCNVVPDYACAHVNVRAPTAPQMEAVDAKMQALASREELTLEKKTYRPPKLFDTAHEKLFNQLKQCGEEIGLTLTWRETGGVCDGNLLAAAGLPTIDTMGVRGGKIHTSEEYLEVSSLIERSALAASFLKKYAAGDL